ncbi:transcriptional regulator, LysR family [Polaromonas sp. OV174]|uniref:LysR family transcriptional regulator n=1 Tax=Polaromonas sp. OV174 TaxID=1855300 RepID=UPI0008EF40F0|nr:LysR family transcriptional regulator [Polaromonas sp. OV174]SFB74804.1 transcriptional regulator, LysR family [Polaromonas sp. OV174]
MSLAEADMRARHLQETALRYFFEVARCGSLTEASERLHVAASALSRQIAGLEQALGTPLFERHPRGMVLNAAGEILATHARRASLDAERAMKEILALQGLRSGRVRIAASEGFANEFLPPLIVAFRAQNEGIVFELNVEPPAQVSARVRNGDVDIGLKFSRAPDKEIKVEYRQPAPVLVLMRPDHPLARASSVTLAQMSAYPVALPAPDTTVRQMIDVECSRQQLLIEPVLSSNNMTTLHNFVVHGGGLSISGEVSVRHLVAAGLLVAIPLRDRGMGVRDIEVQTLVGRSLPQAVQSFLDHLKQYLSGQP